VTRTVRGTPRRSPTVMCVITALVIAVSACSTASLRGDRAWQAGHVAAAAEAYEAARSGVVAPIRGDRLLYRLGLAYASPSSPVCDRELARERLDELEKRFPKSPFSEAAAIVLELLDAVDEGERRVTALTAQVKSAQDDLETRDAGLAQVRVALAETQAELRRTREALDQLKRIDLRRRP
jgi:hypothetical protein